MGFIQSLRSLPPLTFGDSDVVPDETREAVPAPSIEAQFSTVQALQAIGRLDPETLPAIYAAVDLIAASVARLDLVPSSPLSRRPDPFVSRGDFFFESAWSLAAAGNCYWMQTRSPRGVDSLEVLDPGIVTVRWADGSRRRRVYQVEGDLVDASRISHLRFHPRPGELCGLSPVTAARTTWGGAVASESWGAELFYSSGIPSGVLKADYEISKAEADQLKADWDAARAGRASTAVLSGGLSYDKIQFSPADLAWLEHRASTALDVARIFHIPSDLLEVAVAGSSLTYANLGEVGADFVRWCLDSYLGIIAEAWGMLSGEPGPRYFDTAPLYKASSQTRAQTLDALVRAGADFDAAAAATDFPELSPTPSREAELI